MGKPDEMNWFAATWSRVLTEMRVIAGDRPYRLWISTIKLVSADAERVVLSCPSYYARDIVVDRFGARIAHLVQTYAGRPLPIDFISDESPRDPTSGGPKGQIKRPLVPGSIALDSPCPFGTLVVVPSEQGSGAGLPIEPPPTTTPRRLSIEDVKRMTAAYYGVQVADIESKSRQRNFVLPRQVAIFLTKALLARSYPQIGQRFKRDHTSCVHAVQKITRLMETNPDFAVEVEALRQAIRDTHWGQGPTLQ